MTNESPHFLDEILEVSYSMSITTPQPNLEDERRQSHYVLEK
jgi:hypothetical protein